MVLTSPMLVLTRQETAALLEPDSLRRAVAEAMVDVSAGRASMPTRIAAMVPDAGGLLAAMPAFVPTIGGLGAKLVSLFPRNAGTERPTHHAVIVMFDPVNGAPVAVLDGTSITAARTAAGSALATDLLARDDSEVLAIIGTGVQAQSHALAVTRVRPFRLVKIIGRRLDAARALAADVGRLTGIDTEAHTDLDAGCAGADVVCAATHSAEPVIEGNRLVDGVHVTSVGYNIAGREVDTDAIVRSLVVVESRAAVLAAPPAGANELRIPIEEGVITPDHIHAELGELVAGTRPGRAAPKQITLYKSVGVAAQDVAAALLVMRRAREQGIGIEIDI